MHSTFWPNTQFWPSESSKSSHWPEILLKRKNSALFIKILQNAFFRSVAARFGQIAFLSVKVLNIVKLAANSFQNWKTVRFSWKLYKTLFQVTRGTCWPNRVLERQSSQNRETRLKFSSRRKNSALSMKIVQNALFMSCGARFGQIAFLSIKVLKIVTLAPNSLQNRKIVRFLCKLYKTPFFRSCAARFGQITFLSVIVLKIVKPGSNSLQDGKSVRFPWKLYKTLFSGHAQHVLAKYAVLTVRVLKVVTLAWNSCKKGKTVRF